MQNYNFITQNFKVIPYHQSWLYGITFILGIIWSLHYSLTYFYTILGIISLITFYGIYINKYVINHLLVYIMASMCFFLGVLLVLHNKQEHTNVLYQINGCISYKATVVDIEKWYDNKSVITLAIIKPTKAIIKVYIRNSTALEVGDVLAIENLKLFAPENSHHEFYLKKEGLAATAYSKNLNYTLLHRPTYNFWRFLNQQKHRIIASINDKMGTTCAVLFYSIFLGVKHPNKKIFYDLRQRFNNWGLIHFLARSGLHLSCIALIIFFILRLFPIHIFIKKLLILCVLILYSLLTFSSVSFLRAFITNFLYTLYIITNKAIHPIHIFLITTLMVVVYNPYQLFFLDFQLSFGITFLILWFTQSNLIVTVNKKL